MLQFKYFITAVLLFHSQLAFSGLHLGGSYSGARSHQGLAQQEVDAYKGTLSLDLGSYFRVSYSYRQKFDTRFGWLEADEGEGGEDGLLEFRQEVIETTQSIDFVLVLYAGKIFTPFVLAGIALTSYKILYVQEGKDDYDDEAGPFPGPNIGGGLAINLNRRFSLKITATFSPGQETDPITKKTKSVRNSQVDVGLSYKIF